MTSDQIILFSLLFVIFGLLIWGRFRYDLVAFGALVTALILGVVPTDKAFEGFGHPATIVIALVLIVSRALSSSGAIDLLAKYVVDGARSLSSHVTIIAAIGAALSALMNNVAALALLMPLDIKAAEKGKRSPALTLMPLSFATILGGLVTLIGTPPNIIIAAYREKTAGAPFQMFDFAPVGLACAVAGIAFVALIGWRLIPVDPKKTDQGKERFKLDDYIAEVLVPEGAKITGKTVHDLDMDCEEHDVAIIGVVRHGKRLKGFVRRHEIHEGDYLVLEAGPEAIESFVGAKKLKYISAEKHGGLITGSDVTLKEVVIPPGARIEGRSARSMQLLYRHGITLLGVSRQGQQFHERVRKLPIQAGDVLLLMGPSERLSHIADWIGGLPLAERGLQVVNRDMAWKAVAVFSGAIALASFGVLYLPVALALACCLMVLLNIIPIRQVYDSVEWPVIVLLGSMIPIGTALNESGGTALIAEGIVTISAGASPVVVLAILMVVTMTLSDVLNNTATAVIAAPVAIDIANRLNVSADPFLMAVAVAASCAFLTPIGHKNNTLVMGPGGYKFGDYWRMGLPLEILIIVVALPMILIVWPF